MKRDQYQKTWTKPVPVSLPITVEEGKQLGIDLSTDSGEIRGDVKTVGMWQIPVSYRALAMSTKYTPKAQARYSAEQEETTAFGVRTMVSVRQEGYQLEGRVSINGKKYRAFTSSQLFELPDGKLVDVAIIHVCIY